MALTVKSLYIEGMAAVLNDVLQTGFHGTITANGIGGVDVSVYADEDYWAEKTQVDWVIIFSDGVNPDVTETGFFLKDDTRLCVQVPQSTLYVDALEYQQPSQNVAVINQIPAEDETDVAKDRQLRLQVINFLNVANDQIQISIQSTASYLTQTTIYTTAGGFQNGFTGTVTPRQSPGAGANDETDFVITAPADFISLEECTITVTANPTGYDSETYSYTFTIEDLTAPEISWIRWLTPRKAMIKFNEPVVQLTTPPGVQFNKFFEGSVQILDNSRIYIPGGNVTSTWVGYFLRLSRTVHPVNHDTHTITAVDTTANIVTVTPADLKVDDGVDRDDLNNILRQRAIYCNISNWKFEFQADQEGADELPYSAERIQCGFEPLIKSVEAVPSIDLPEGEDPDQYLYLNTDDDISISRIYKVICHQLKDEWDNIGTDVELQFTTQRFGIPPNIFNMWSDGIFPITDKIEDLQTNQLIRKMAVVINDIFNVLWHRVYNITALLDAYECPAHMLDILLHDLGNPFTFPIETDRMKRLLADNLDTLYSRIGTERGIVDFLKKLLGYDFEIHLLHEEFHWKLGDTFWSQLGITTTLGTDSRYARNCYEIDSPTTLTTDERRIVTDVAEWSDSARMHLLRINYPGGTYMPYWTLGSSKLGIDTFLGV